MGTYTSFARLVAAALIAGSLGLCSVSAAGAAPERSADGAVIVRASGDVMDGIGAGTIVGVSGATVTVLTAKHVATYGPVSVRFADGTRADARIVSLVHDRDLALVAASVAPEFAATLHVAHIGRPSSNLSVHVWGSGNDGPAFEPAAVRTVGTALPDGVAHARYTLACDLCHQGDSGAGVFDARGELVGVYVGFFKMDNGRLSVAEQPLDDAELAAGGVSSAKRTTVVAANFSHDK